MSSAQGNLLVSAMDPLPPHCVGVLVAVQSYSGAARAARAKEILRLAHGIEIESNTLEHIYLKIEACCPELFAGISMRHVIANAPLNVPPCVTHCTRCGIALRRWRTLSAKHISSSKESMEVTATELQCLSCSMCYLGHWEYKRSGKDGRKMEGLHAIRAPLDHEHFLLPYHGLHGALCCPSEDLVMVYKCAFAPSPGIIPCGCFHLHGHEQWFLQRKTPSRIH